MNKSPETQNIEALRKQFEKHQTTAIRSLTEEFAQKRREDIKDTILFILNRALRGQKNSSTTSGNTSLQFTLLQELRDQYATYADEISLQDQAGFLAHCIFNERVYEYGSTHSKLISKMKELLTTVRRRTRLSPETLDIIKDAERLLQTINSAQQNMM